jgi:hypothetical protein
MVMALWEHMAGAEVVHLLSLIAEQASLALVFGLHYLGHENSDLSLFVSTESDPRGNGLRHLKPGVDIGDLILESTVSYYDLISGPDSGKF